MDNDERLFDEIAGLQDENNILKEVRDELMDENEKLRISVNILKGKLKKEVK